jgi:hypothetical protein
MDGAHTREFHMPRLASALAVIALFAAVLAPTAGATSPSQDQYGSALPGVGSGGGGSPSTSSPSGTAQSTIPVAPGSSSSTQTSGSQTSGGSSASSASSGNGGGSSHAGSKGGSSQKGAKAAHNGSANSQNQVNANNANNSVPHIAADSAGDSWVPWFIAGLLALGAAGGVLVYRNRRRAAQS